MQEYKNPPIAKLLIDDGLHPYFHILLQSTKKGFFRKHEYVYDEYTTAISPETIIKVLNNE